MLAPFSPDNQQQANTVMEGRNRNKYQEKMDGMQIVNIRNKELKVKTCGKLYL